MKISNFICLSLVSLSLLALVSLLAVAPVLAQGKGKKGRAAPEPGPRLSISETVFEAGEVPAGSRVSHDFIIKNTGQRELKILRVAAGCGCTAASFDKSISPGQSGKVTVSVSYYEDWAGRQVKQSALLETNDPAARYTSLTVGAKVVSGK